MADERETTGTARDGARDAGGEAPRDGGPIPGGGAPRDDRAGGEPRRDDRELREADDAAPGVGAGSIAYGTARFVAAYGDARKLPESTTPEVSFIGRSNVGKSSLLNRLFKRKALAKVSSRPGKTATVNFFDVDGIMFVDLPGYGFAQVGNRERENYGRLIAAYLEGERSHNLVVQLVDVRHDPTALDRETTAMLQELGLPFVIALTKADKLSKSKAAGQRDRTAKALGVDRADVIVTSATAGTGMDDLRRRIAAACL